MPKEANVGVKISSGQAQNDIKKLAATILTAVQAFEQANIAATQQETVLRQLSTDMKKTIGATEELKAATLREKQAKVDSINALAQSRTALAAAREETVKLTSAKVALANQNLRNKQSNDSLLQSRIASTEALRQQRLAHTALIDKKKELITQNAKVGKSTDAITARFSRLKKIVATFIIGTGIKAAVGTLTDFEYTMKRLGFITKATESKFQSLTDTARELGATTQYTAANAAKGMQYLGLVGLNTQQVIATIPSVLSLATSASIDMGTAADITAKAMTAFNINAEDTNRIADVLVQTMTSANTDVVQLGDAFKFVAPIANAAGLSLEDAAAAVGAVSDSGIQASLAGTGLRRAIQALLNPTVKAQKALQILGLSVDDVSTKYNSLQDIITKLSQAGLGELPELSFDIFGLRGAPVIQALISNIDKLKDLEASYKSTIGVAKEGADVLNNTLRAAFKRLTSVIQETVLATGENGLLWVLRGLVETSTSVIRVITGVGDASERASVIIKGLAFGLEALTATAIISGLSKLVTLLRSAAVAGTATGAGFPLLAIGVTLATVTPLIIDAGKAIKDFIFQEDEYIDKTDEIKKSTLEGADAFETMQSSLDNVSFSGDLSGIEALTDKLTELSNAEIDSRQQISTPMKDSWLLDLAPSLEKDTDASKELNKELAILESRRKNRNTDLRELELTSEYASKIKDESLSMARAIINGEPLLKSFSEGMRESAEVADELGFSYQGASSKLTSFMSNVATAGEKLRTYITGAGKSEDEIAIKGVLKLLDGLKLKYDETYATSEKLSEAQTKQARTMEILKKGFKDGLVSQDQIDEANRIFGLWIDSLTSKSDKASQKIASKLARDRERITGTLMKTILPEYDLDYKKIMDNIAEAQRTGVETQTIATYKRIALQELEAKKLKDFVDAYEDEIKLQERAGAITKEMAVEALEALLPDLSKTSEEYLTLSKAIEKYNDSIDKDVEKDKRKQINALKEALGVIHQEFDVGKFEILSDSDMAMQKEALETLLEQVKQLKGDTPGLVELIRTLRKEIDEIPDETNKAKEATQEWMHSFEEGITQAIMGAESLGDAFANLANQIAEYMINMALWGASGEGGLLGGFLGDIFRANGGPVQPGKAYIVGERQPELFVPQTAGQIIPSVPSAGYQSTINVSVNVETKGDLDDAESAKIGKIVADIIDQRQAKTIKTQQRSGGLFRKPYSGVSV